MTRTSRTSFRAFAKSIGVVHSAVSKAAQTGRLAKSLGYDEQGRVFIADVALARREWAENAGKPAPPLADESAAPPLSKKECDEMLVHAVTFVLATSAAEAVLTWDPDGTPNEFDPRKLLTWLRGNRSRRTR